MRILYIDIDSQRADRLGCYGYHRNTSPNIDALSREGVTFRNYYTADAPCLPSRTAMYSGRFGIQTGVVGHGGTAAQPKVEGKFRAFRDVFDTQGLAKQLQSAGLHTAMISPFGQRHAAHWFYAGFNEIHNTGLGGLESAEHVKPVMDKWFQDNCAKDDWFMHINFWDPHTPYRVPMDYGHPFADEPLPKHLDDPELLAKHMKTVGPHSAMEFGMYVDGWNKELHPRSMARIDSMQNMRKCVDGYDTAVRYVDDHVGQMFKYLKDAGVYDDTIIIVSADHGENFGELGVYAEHGTADQATCRIPMIFKFPGGKQGHVADGFHYNIDMAPTLMDLIGGRNCPPLWDGQSYADTIRTGADCGRDQLVISQCCHVAQRSVRWDKWLYMRTFHDGFRLFPREMLFDLEADPYEQNDIAEQHPEICREGAARYLNWHQDQMDKMADTSSDIIDPLWTVINEGGPYHALHEPGRSPLPKYIERLRETGRAEGADQLEDKYAKYLKP